MYKFDIYHIWSELISEHRKLINRRNRQRIMKKQVKITKDDIPKLLAAQLPQFAGKKLRIESKFGMTNQTYKISAESADAVIFRILSPIIDRKYENRVLQKLDSNNICPNTLYACQGYRIEEYIKSAKHPTSHQLNENSQLLQKVLQKLHLLHEIRLPKQLQKSFLETAVFGAESKKKYSNAICRELQKQTQFNELKNNVLSQHQELHKKVITYFKTKFHSFKLTHNDTNNKNIFLKENQQGREVLLIDFEYACYNYVAYDIANLLNECCFDYMEELPGFRVFKKVSNQQIKRACELYPGNYEGLENDVKFMLAICNYYWALWSLLATPTTAFSPTEHGKARYEMYKFYLENSNKK